MFERDTHHSFARSRWAALGAAVAVTLGAGGAGWVAHAGAGSVSSAFVSITPCRLFDTRASDQVGDRSTPLATSETWVRQVWGTNGQCTIPSTATAIAYNLSVPDPTVTGFLTLYPADASLPGSSSINPVANGGTKGNSGIVGLSATGALAVFNHDGPVDAILDITGYYVPGGAGATGAAGPRGFSAWDTIPSGVTVTGEIDYDGHQASLPRSPAPTPPEVENGTDSVVVNLPGVASTALTDATVNFDGASGASVAETDGKCGGNFQHPTAPAGKVCIYVDITGGITLSSLIASINDLPTRAFFISWHPTGAVDTDEYLYATWAYTAP